ncbi:sensor histidine kinase [Paenibacillus sp. FSL H7-0331]|uniref:sensor histidine kinase n=1 Tax=Paenibacillus sp. FSL H7-0331 TaxID=1920421 RepID=UPI0015C38061|nr:sensor histidine kinase [Paenibacillus sp. FSL H7-0331]
MPIRKKIQIINILIILPSILFLTITLYNMTLNQVMERALRSSDHKLELITNTINTLFNNIENYSKLAIINKPYQSVLNSDGTDPQSLEDIQLMYVGLTSLVESSPYIDSVVIQSIQGNKTYYTNNLTNVTENNLSIYPGDQLITAKGSAVWIETFQSPFLVNAQHINLLAVGRRIINISNGIPLGYIYINMDESKLSKLYGNDEEGLQSKLMIINANGTIISSNDPGLLQTTLDTEKLQMIFSNDNSSQIFDNGKETTIISSKALSKKDWRIVYEVPSKALMKDQWKITLFILGYGALGLLFALVLSIVFSNWITKPIVRLSRAMMAVGNGKLDTRSPITSKDEVGQLAYKFNDMVGEIQGLMDTVNQEEKQKRSLELRLMYSQIKPHFLYNTLETIRSMALMTKAHDISKVVKALGDFYRMSLNKGQELIPVIQEKKHLESYLYIQTIRYSHIDYIIDFDSQIENCRIPNMLLQPLVENSIQHGLREKQTGALCEISGFIETKDGADVVCFVIKDNGKGMNEELLANIWHREQNQLDLSSFGIRNIQERIQLRYGPGYGISISSVIGSGVEVQLRIPLAFDKKGLPERSVKSS